MLLEVCESTCVSSTKCLVHVASVHRIEHIHFSYGYEAVQGLLKRGDRLHGNGRQKVRIACVVVSPPCSHIAALTMMFVSQAVSMARRQLSAGVIAAVTNDPSAHIPVPFRVSVEMESLKAGPLRESLSQLPCGSGDGPLAGRVFVAASCVLRYADHRFDGNDHPQSWFLLRSDRLPLRDPVFDEHQYAAAEIVVRFEGILAPQKYRRGDVLDPQHCFVYGHRLDVFSRLPEDPFSRTKLLQLEEDNAHLECVPLDAVLQSVALLPYGQRNGRIWEFARHL